MELVMGKFDGWADEPPRLRFDGETSLSRAPGIRTAAYATVQEAFRLLDLIDAEFRSDPMSTACFDARVVLQVRQCVDRWKKEQRE